MLITKLLLIFSMPQMDDTEKVVNEPAAVVSEKATKDSTLVASAALPSAPEPKVKADPEPIAPNPAAQPFVAVRPAIVGPRETPRPRKIWDWLMVAGHSGAAVDAWSTKRAGVGGYRQEANPFLRPFANSNAIFPATQLSPAFID